MTLQAQFNQEAIDMLPITSDKISVSDRPGHDRSVVLRAINDSPEPISEMADWRLLGFDIFCSSLIN